jgi:Ca-activated chloride channel family protein
MHRRNNQVVGLFLFLLLVTNPFMGIQAQPNQASGAQAQGTQRVQPTSLPPDIDPNDPAIPVWARPVGVANNAGKPPATAANVPAQPGKQPDQPVNEGAIVGEVTKNSSGGFTYKSIVNEVTLSATVLDTKRHLVTNLDKTNFVVYEDGQPQNITSFIRRDIPVSIGIVVDNSGSMRTKRTAVSKAVLNLIQASNPQDEVFVVNFNDDPYLDQDFTNKLDVLHEALDRVDSRGGTALYDAVIASADHLAKGAKKEKKVLLVVTDGVDNESRESLESAIRSVQNDSGPTIYTIGILGDEPGTKRARSNGGYRRVRVEAHAPGYKDLQVRTRDGYFADEKHTASTKQ